MTWHGLPQVSVCPPLLERRPAQTGQSQITDVMMELLPEGDELNENEDSLKRRERAAASSVRHGPPSASSRFTERPSSV